MMRVVSRLDRSELCYDERFIASQCGILTMDRCSRKGPERRDAAPLPRRVGCGSYLVMRGLCYTAARVAIGAGFALCTGTGDHMKTALITGVTGQDGSYLAE